MEWNWHVNAHDQWGEISEEGVYLNFNETATIRFDDPTDLLRFAEAVQKSMDEIVDAWNNSAVDE